MVQFSKIFNPIFNHCHCNDHCVLNCLTTICLFLIPKVVSMVFICFLILLIIGVLSIISAFYRIDFLEKSKTPITIFGKIIRFIIGCLSIAFGIYLFYLYIG